LIVVAALLGAAWLGGVALLRPRTYTTSTTFTPQSHRATSGAGGIAAQLGLAVAGGDVTESPQFYSDLLQSRALLDTVVRQPLRSLHGTTLLSRWGKGDQEPVRAYTAVLELRKHIHTTVGTKVGSVGLEVTDESPSVSYEVAQTLLQQLNRFNLETRQTQAKAEREFTQQRLQQAETDLRASESRLQAFDQDNRAILSSPRLNLERERLLRDIATHQQVYGTLVQAFEQAKIDEVRDTPVFTVVEPPSFPVLPDTRGTIGKIAIGLLMGLLIGIAVTVTIEYLRSRRTAEPEVLGEWRATTRAAGLDWRRPWRFFTHL